MTPAGDTYVPPGPPCIGVLLAGGEARRLGADKHALRIGGKTLLERNLALLASIFPRVAVSLRVGQELGGSGESLAAPAELLTDAWTGSPLAAIVTALDHYREPVFVLACDLALAERRAIEEVLEAFVAVDVALPVVDGKLEPLHAAYGPACLRPMRRLLERGRHRIVESFPDVRVAGVPFPTARPFFNINHPEDYEAALRREVQRLLDKQTALQPEGAEEAEAPPAGAPPQPALVAIVGKSDSGKTTLIERLLPELRALGLRVGTVKHDVHGFEIDTPGKDSWRHGRAGAEAYAVAGPGQLAYVRALETELPLADIARRYFGDVDMLVAEGYKRQAPHRVEVFRAAAGHAEPLCGPGEALAIVTDAPLEHERRFALDDAAGLARFIASRLDDLRRY